MIPFYRGDYCRWHSDQAPIVIEQQYEPVKFADLVGALPLIFGMIVFFGVSFIVEPAFAVGCLLIPFALLVMGFLIS